VDDEPVVVHPFPVGVPGGGGDVDEEAVDLLAGPRVLEGDQPGGADGDGVVTGDDDLLEARRSPGRVAFGRGPASLGSLGVRSSLQHQCDEPQSHEHADHNEPSQRTKVEHVCP
jgi:hypothetical protein